MNKEYNFSKDIRENFYNKNIQISYLLTKIKQSEKEILNSKTIEQDKMFKDLEDTLFRRL